jgi:serine/threonine-protein kinase RsbW
MVAATLANGGRLHRPRLVRELRDPDHADDVCLLCLTLGTEQRLERSIGADPMQIALLRKDLRGWLTSHSVDEESAQAVLLACSEAVANAIEHAYAATKAAVELQADVSEGEVTVTVSDSGQWRPQRESPRGRGLGLMRALMDAVEVSSGQEGTTVELRRRLGREAAVGGARAERE